MLRQLCVARHPSSLQLCVLLLLLLDGSATGDAGRSSAVATGRQNRVGVKMGAKLNCFYHLRWATLGLWSPGFESALHTSSRSHLPLRK